MALDEKDLAAAKDKGASEALATERQRVKDIRAAFPKHPGFAAEQIEKGATLQEARAAFADVVLAENEALTAKLKVGATQPAGEDPLRDNGNPGDAAVGQKTDFMSRAKAYAAENGCTMRKAMSEVAKEDPACFDKFAQAAIEAAPAHAARKRELGISK